MGLCSFSQKVNLLFLYRESIRVRERARDDIDLILYIHHTHTHGVFTHGRRNLNSTAFKLSDKKNALAHLNSKHCINESIRIVFNNKSYFVELCGLHSPLFSFLRTQNILLKREECAKKKTQICQKLTYKCRDTADFIVEKEKKLRNSSQTISFFTLFGMNVCPMLVTISWFFFRQKREAYLFRLYSRYNSSLRHVSPEMNLLLFPVAKFLVEEKCRTRQRGFQLNKCS